MGGGGGGRGDGSLVVATSHPIGTLAERLAE